VGKDFGGISMNKPLFSIITPTFNRRDFLEINIKSLLNQSYQNFEHIVIDGGSTDGTIELLKKYESQYNMRWISEPDNGIYDAVNKGIKMAQGEIIAYLNSDDFYFPWTLESVALNFASQDEILFGDCLIIDTNMSKVKIRIHFQPSKFDYKKMVCYHGLSLPQPSTFIKRELFEVYGLFDTNFKLFGDLEFWARLGSNNVKFRKLSELLSIVTFHGNNLHLLKEIGNREKENIKQKYCHGNKKRKYEFLRYIDQCNVRLELFKFLLRKDNHKHFKEKFKNINKFILFFIELLPNRVKFALNINWIEKKEIEMFIK
jgi:glycosyltransferase involved in cell wall biosynthesis